MDAKQPQHCIFCGSVTDNYYLSTIGLISVHTDCLIDLDKFLLFSDEEFELEVLHMTGG